MHRVANQHAKSAPFLADIAKSLQTIPQREAEALALLTKGQQILSELLKVRERLDKSNYPTQAPELQRLRILNLKEYASIVKNNEKFWDKSKMDAAATQKMTEVKEGRGGGRRKNCQAKKKPIIISHSVHS
jgi:hypothetical protein